MNSEIEVTREMDVKSYTSDEVSIYLDCTYIPSPYSIYNDVYKLPPGNNLEIYSFLSLDNTFGKVISNSITKSPLFNPSPTIFFFV